MPYALDVLKGVTKPRIVSWLTWSLLTVIGCAASFAAHQFASAILLAFASAETSSIVVLGLRKGDHHFERFDVICQTAAIIGLVLWLVFDSPTIAIVATVAIDLVGALPTLKHIWQKPHEETWLTFALAGIGAACTIAAANGWKITAVAYPMYITLINAVFVTIIFVRRKHAVPGEPAELHEL